MSRSAAAGSRARPSASVGLAVPVVRRAEALVGEPLVGAKLTHYERGRPYGWLTRRRHAANLFKVG